MVPSHSVLERVLRPAEGDLPADFARKLLDMDFEPADHERYRKLSAKAQSGDLTPQEQVDLDDLLTANDVLTILQAKARISLSHPSSAA